MIGEKPEKALKKEGCMIPTITWGSSLMVPGSIAIMKFES